MEQESTAVSEVAIARAVDMVVRSVPGVASISPGRFAEVATYGPGVRVPGVTVSRATGMLEIGVHVCAVHAAAPVLPDLADRIREAVREALAPLGVEPVRAIDVAIDDLEVEEG